MDLQIILPQIRKILGCGSGCIRYADGALITVIAPRDPGGHQLVEFEILICSPPVHLGGLVGSGIHGDVHPEGIFIGRSPEAHPEPQEILLFVVTI